MLWKKSISDYLVGYRQEGLSFDEIKKLLIEKKYKEVEIDKELSIQRRIETCQEFIKKKLTEGADPKEIKKILTDQGWPVSLLKRCFTLQMNFKEPPSPPTKKVQQEIKQEAKKEEPQDASKQPTKAQQAKEAAKEQASAKEEPKPIDIKPLNKNINFKFIIVLFVIAIVIILTISVFIFVIKDYELLRYVLVGIGLGGVVLMIMHFTRKIIEKQKQKKDNQAADLQKTLSSAKDSKEKDAQNKDEKVAAEKSKPVTEADVERVLRATDQLLERLPQEVVDEFLKSKDFELYEKVLEKYNIK